MEPKLSKLKFDFKPANKDKSIFVRLTSDLREAINLISVETNSYISDVARGLMEVGFVLYEEQRRKEFNKLKKGNHGR